MLKLILNNKKIYNNINNTNNNESCFFFKEKIQDNIDIINQPTMINKRYNRKIYNNSNNNTKETCISLKETKDTSDIIKQPAIIYKKCNKINKINKINSESYVSLKEKTKPPENTNFYVIHMINNEQRLNNINNMITKLNKNIKIFDAIDGLKLNVDKIDNLINKKLCTGEIGCYLSHANLISTIEETENYSIIFEDDFNITDNFNKELTDIINSIDINFDIIFLGNFTENYGENYINNIYYVNTNHKLLGAHGYLINNKNIKKINNLLLDIDYEIDIKYKYLIDNNLLDCFTIYPVIVNQNTNLPSTINRKLNKYVKTKKLLLLI